MAQQIPPVQQLELHGVYTAGNPAGRPRGSAAKCENFRVMPGYWLRTRGGRKARYYVSGAEVQQIERLRDVDHPGSDNQLAQIKYSGPSVKWTSFTILTYIIDPFGIETISLAYDGSFSASNPAAVCNLNDRPVFYNGLGVRGASDSKPPFSTYAGGVVRFFGLDAFCPGGTNPTAAFAVGAGYNSCLSHLRIYAGLYNSSTGHYSNGVYCGTVTTTSALGTITVSNLTRLKYAYHNATEQAELYYVFYATIDGGEIPYLILNSTLDGPHKVATGSSSASLSISATANNGFDRDLTKEVPITNDPPRPMRSIAYVNGRLYGALLAGGSGAAVPQTVPGATAPRPDFSYVPTARELAAVVWSAAASDAIETEALGDPLQSWPALNIAYTPSLEAPVIVTPADDDAEGQVPVLVITPSKTFLLVERSDGLHEWIRVSPVHGITVPKTLCQTPYGVVWVTQRNQMVVLPPGSRSLRVLSKPFQNLLTGATPRCADYLLDPINEVDRYQVFLSSGTSVIYDFEVGGEAYTATDQDFTAASTVFSTAGVPHHIVAKAGFYTQEGQPEDGLIPTTEETFTGTAQDRATTQISGEYVRNWDDFTDGNVRKEFPQLDVIGDGALSAALGNVAPLSVEWYGDFEQVAAANRKLGVLAKAPQSSTDSSYRAKFTAGHRFWFKLVLKLAGHSADDSTFTKHQAPATQGDLARNFYGSILRLALHIGQTENRA